MSVCRRMDEQLSFMRRDAKAGSRAASMSISAMNSPGSGLMVLQAVPPNVAKPVLP